jgi:PAS domain-containing protein
MACKEIGGKRKKDNVPLPDRDHKPSPVDAKDISDLTPDDIQILKQDLKTYQLKLASQVEESRRIQEDLQHSRDKYQELYDTFPVGYFTIDRNYLILDANAQATKMLHAARNSLLK